MDNLENFLSAPAEGGEAAPEVEAIEAEAEVVEQETETEEAKAQRERDEKGRFKAKETEEPVMVPLKALHETRDELKALKAELDKIRVPQQPPEPQQAPDIFEDPQGFTQFQNNQFQSAIVNERLNLSEEMVRTSEGDEAVEAAQQWGAQAFQANPALYQQFLSQRNPYRFLVTEHKRQTALAEIGNNPTEFEEFRAWKQQRASAAQPAPAQAPVVPATLADAQSARGSAASDGFTVPSLSDILRR